MFEIVGLCKKTLKWVTVAVATNKMELAIILIEESGNYYGLRFARLRMAG